jgi:ATP-dependent exoDNAse (exonuclease V) alpha subunit
MLLPQNIGKIQPNDFGSKFTERHITFTNKRRTHINKIMMERKATKNKYLQLDKLIFDDNSQDVKLTNGMPLIARKNAKELDIFNNEQFIIKNIEFDKENIIIVSDINEDKIIDIPFDLFQRLFYPAYAITIYKSQGSTFDHPFSVHEWSHPLFNNILKYVALSRSTMIDNINIYTATNDNPLEKIEKEKIEKDRLEKLNKEKLEKEEL